AVWAHTAKTGMSDTLRPGDVSSLSQSDEVAFRVRFDGVIPATSSLYWRGVVMSRLEGDTWGSLRYLEIPARERRKPVVATEGDFIDYRVIIEPTQQNWLYSLRYAQPRNAGVMSLSDYRLFLPAVVENDYLYRVRSWPDTRLGLELSDWRRRVETRLPPQDNPRTRELARTLYAESGTTQGFVSAALAHFRNQEFFYTLQPPTLGDRDVMDRFLFETRRGFCEHYAYAFAVMARSLGIPARIVGGYLGGEVNPVHRTVIVHQFDAHAWNEVWIEGEGWVRVDPTAAVAPDRILYGLERAVAGEGSFLADSPLSPLRFRGVDWINGLRLRYDALTYRWQSWITGFDGDAQFDLLRGVFGEVSPSRSMAVLLGVGVGTMSLVSLLLLRSRRAAPRSLLETELERFARRLHDRGLEREPGETPAQLVARAVQRWPGYAPRIHRLYGSLEAAVYGPVVVEDEQRLARELRRKIRALRP
ncbi:MAG: DUF3488 and transglutaminase-like domain-containing protein, partial [Pseudomonadota bacterium]